MLAKPEGKKVELAHISAKRTDSFIRNLAQLPRDRSSLRTNQFLKVALKLYLLRDRRSSLQHPPRAIG